MQERQWQCLSPSPTRPPSRANHRQWSCAACKIAREEHFRQLVLSRSGHCALVLNRTRERLNQAFRSPNGVSLSMADPWSGPDDFWLDQANARQASLLRGGLPVCPYNWGSGHAKGWLFAPSVWAANARAPALRMDCSCDASLHSRPQRVAFLKKGSLHSDRVGRTGSPAERWCGSRSAAGRQFDAEIVECRGGSPFGIKWVKRRCISRNWTTMLDDQLSLRTQVLRRLLSPRPPDPTRPDSCLGEVELFSRFNQVVLRPLPAVRGFGVEAITFPDYATPQHRQNGYTWALRTAAELRRAVVAAEGGAPSTEAERQGDPLWMPYGNDCPVPPILMLRTEACDFQRAQDGRAPRLGYLRSIEKAELVHYWRGEVPRCGACCRNEQPHVGSPTMH